MRNRSTSLRSTSAISAIPSIWPAWPAYDGSVTVPSTATLTASTSGDVSRIVAWTVPMACELAWAPSMVALRASSWVCDAIPKISFATWR